MNDFANQQLKEMGPGSLVYDPAGRVWIVAGTVSEGYEVTFSLIRTRITKLREMMREEWHTADSDAIDVHVDSATQKEVVDALIASINKRVAAMTYKESMTPTRAEYWKAGARSAILTINAAIEHFRANDYKELPNAQD